MWYNIDFTKFCRQMLPPILRSSLLMAMLTTMIVPLRYVYRLFKNLKAETDNSLNISANVINLQGTLNEVFFLKLDQIYIETPKEENKRILYFESENQTNLPLHFCSEGKGQYLWERGENTVKYNFVVYVPTFLCTSLNKDEDKYRGEHLDKIMSVLNKYKPAGRTFSIELYDYE